MNWINWIIENREWIFGGVGITIIVGLIRFFIKKPEDIWKEKNINKNINKVTVNNIVNKQGNEKIERPEHKMTSDEIKKIINILFIDDDVNFKIIKILQKSGWNNTKIKKDIKSLDDKNIQEAHICFVDIQGVAKDLFKDEGLGLAGALKNKYPNKKIIVYSGQTTGDRFHESLRKVDATLRKDAEPYQFENLVEKLSENIF